MHQQGHKILDKMFSRCRFNSLPLQCKVSCSLATKTTTANQTNSRSSTVIHRITKRRRHPALLKMSCSPLRYLFRTSPLRRSPSIEKQNRDLVSKHLVSQSNQPLQTRVKLCVVKLIALLSKPTFPRLRQK